MSIFIARKFLGEWSLVKSASLDAKLNSTVRGYAYYYHQRSYPESLSIKVYFQQQTDGNVSRLISLYDNVPPGRIRWKIIGNPEQGYYAIYNYQKNLHLTACVFKDGYGIVTEQQFSLRRLKTIDFSENLFPWLLGIKPLMAGDCWWFLVSTPLAADGSYFKIKTSIAEIQNFWQAWLRESNFSW